MVFSALNGLAGRGWPLARVKQLGDVLQRFFGVQVCVDVCVCVWVREKVRGIIRWCGCVSRRGGVIGLRAAIPSLAQGDVSGGSGPLQRQGPAPAPVRRVRDRAEAVGAAVVAEFTPDAS